LVVNVPRFIVKLVAATTAEISGSAVVIPVLHVTLRRVPVVVSFLPTIKISLLAVTAVVFTVQVPVLALVAHENDPAAAAVHEATEGFAAVPTAAQFVPVAYRPAFSVPNEFAKAVPTDTTPAAVLVRAVSTVTAADKSAPETNTTPPLLGILKPLLLLTEAPRNPPPVSNKEPPLLEENDTPVLVPLANE